MNQATTFTHYNNLTKDEKSDHDFDGYTYIYHSGRGIWQPYTQLSNCEDKYIYRLEIEPEKFYMVLASNGFIVCPNGIIKGSDIDQNQLSRIGTLRPATIDEISKKGKK